MALRTIRIPLLTPARYLGSVLLLSVDTSIVGCLSSEVLYLFDQLKMEPANQNIFQLLSQTQCIIEISLVQVGILIVREKIRDRTKDRLIYQILLVQIR